MPQQDYSLHATYFQKIILIFAMNKGNRPYVHQKYSGYGMYADYQNHPYFIMNKLLLSFLLLGTTASAQGETPLWMRYNAISPNGKQIAFAYQGDIYVVDSRGGNARQLTTGTSYESSPIWSNDGRTIAFTSDRNGGTDIYTIPAKGGPAKRVTCHSTNETPLAFSADDKEIYFSATLQDPAKSILAPAHWQTELYRIRVEGGRPQQVTATAVSSIDFDKDGQSFLYYNRTGSENIWRKHHTSSVARDIFYYDAKHKQHRQITSHPGEDRDPHFTPDGKMVFLSERDGGSFNVYCADLNAPQNVQALTHFKKHPVRFLSQAKDGTLCFGFQGEIYTLTPGKKPQKVAVNIVRDYDNNTINEIHLYAPAEISLSDDGKEIALLSRGEVFATTEKYGTTRQITHTAAAEEGITMSPDGKTIVYASEKTGVWNLYSAKRTREEDLHFAYATLIEEEPLFKDNQVERTHPTFSPDGKEIAFIEDRNRLKVLNLKSGEVRTVTDGSKHYSRHTGGFNYQWSPDGKWFALEIITNRRDPYADIAIVSADGDGKYHNVTNSAYIDMSPQWVMGGNALLYTSNRHGMRSHASWGSLEDVYISFMNQETMDKFLMDEEEYALFKEREKAEEEKTKKEKATAKTDGKKPKKDNKPDKEGSKSEEEQKDNTVKMDLKKINERIVRLTPMSSHLGSAVLSNDGETLYFTAAFEKGMDLWKVNTRTRSIQLFKKGMGGSLKLSKDGKSLYVLNGSPTKLSLPSGSPTNISFSMSMELDRAAEREYMFNHVFKQEEEKFYDRNYHGVDLKALKKDYQPFLAHISNNYDFSEMLSEILGELNVSHTGAGYRPAGPKKPTPEFGLLFDMNYQGDGLKIDEVLDFGPFDNFTTKVKAGDIIEKIDGKDIKAGEDYYALINGKGNRQTLLSFYNPEKKERWEETTPLISKGKQNGLLYRKWIKTMEHLVDSLSGGRLGYVHIASMNDASYRDVYSDILGKYNLKEGIVIDTRNNGGGRLHEDIEILFSGKKYLEQVIQGRVACEMPSRRYNKPSIMLVCESNYSNAHGTPWVYQTMGLGKVVGMPVPGTMTSVNWETLQDESMYFGIPVVGYRTAQGNYLENTQLEPDVKVRNEYEKAVNGIDQQLEAAVRELLKEIDKQKK